MFCYVCCACYTCSAASQQSTTEENFLLGNKYFVTSTSTSTLQQDWYLEMWLWIRTMNMSWTEEEMLEIVQKKQLLMTSLQ